MTLLMLVLLVFASFAFAALVCPDVGEVEMGDKMMKDALVVDESYTLKLYSAVAPAISEDSVAADFTECTFTGYVAKVLTRAGWAGMATVVGTTSSSYAQQSWSPTTSETVTGYWVIGTTSTILLWCEAFAAPRVVQNGDTLLLTPRMAIA